MPTMKAIVIRQAGGPEVLKIENLPIPTPKPGEVLIRVKAFGLNRSELFTRRGTRPTVKFSRVLGIEAAGIVEDSPSGEFQQGDVVLTAMGGLGRELFDGGYAEYTCVPSGQVQLIRTSLDLDDPGSHARNAGDGVGVPLPFAATSKGRDTSGAGRNYLCGASRICDCKELRSARELPRRVILTVSRCCARQARTRYFRTTGPLRSTFAAPIQRALDKVLELIGTTTLEDSPSLRPRGRRGLYDWHRQQRVGVRELRADGEDSYSRVASLRTRENLQIS